MSNQGQKVSEILEQYIAEKRFADAVVLCDQLLSVSNHAHTKALKGWCLYQNGESDKAEPFIFEAFAQAPSENKVVTLVLSYLMALCRYKDVIRVCQQSIAFHASDRLMWHRLGTAHYLTGEFNSSITAFKQGLSVVFSESSSFGMSLPLLSQGKYQEAFALYEYRFACHPKLNWLQCEKLPMPKWQGEPLKGKALLIWSEQGLGDSIQFSRFVNVLVAQGAEVDLILQASHAGLAELLRSLKGVGKVMVVSNNVVSLHRRYDYHCSMMSLMGAMGLTPETIVGDTPYLYAPKSNTLTLDDTAPSGDMKIGLVWTTQLTNSLLKNNAMHYVQKDKKSLSIEAIEPLLGLTGARFFILQMEVSEQDQKVLDQYNTETMSSKMSNFADTAAIIDAMDVVISIDTSVVHLAGAMGKPVINLLPALSDWRWQKNREDSPWYPSMRLCQQMEEGNWDELVQRLITITSRSLQRFQRDGSVSIFS